jgi:hypothetical protein
MRTGRVVPSSLWSKVLIIKITITGLDMDKDWGSETCCCFLKLDFFYSFDTKSVWVYAL